MRAPTSLPTVVIGNGWAALGALGFFSQKEKPLIWLTGTGARVLPPFPVLQTQEGFLAVQAWQELANLLNIKNELIGQVKQGSFLREYRNKAFREPPWTRAPTLEMRREIIKEWVSEFESSFVPLFEARFTVSLAELEEWVREKLFQKETIQRIENIPLMGVTIEKNKIQAVILVSGEEIACDQVIYADRWNVLSSLKGIPQPLDFLKKRQSAGILQAKFIHEIPFESGLQEWFFAPLGREVQEEIERHVWGYFSSDGQYSVWTIDLLSEETESNHEIMKKLRRMKAVLEKIFQGHALFSPLLAQGKSSFMSNVKDEQVHFEDSFLFFGKPLFKAVQLPQTHGLSFITDAYGPSSALVQVRSLLEWPQSQTKNMDFLDSPSF